MGFRLYSDVIELPCKWEGTTLYVGTPEYYKTVEFPYVKFGGLSFGWQQYVFREGDYHLRGKLVNKTFTLLIDSKLNVCLVHNKTKMIIAYFISTDMGIIYTSSYVKSGDALPKKVGTLRQENYSENPTLVQIIREDKSDWKSFNFSTQDNGSHGFNQPKDFTFLMPVRTMLTSVAFIVKTSEADKLSELARRIDYISHALPIYEYTWYKNGHKLHIVETDEDVELLDVIMFGWKEGERC